MIKTKYDIDIKHIISISDRDLNSLKLKMETINFDIKNLDFTPLISDYKYKDQKEIEKKEEEDKNKEKDKEEQSGTNNKKKPKSNLSRLLLILLTSVLFMGIVFLPKTLKDKTPIEEITESEQTVIVESPSPVPSPSPQFYPNLYSIQVLNGTSVGGLATTTKELLEENGYQDVEIGNAEDDYILTEIITDDDKDLIKHLTEILESKYTISTATSTTSLTSDLDAIVILGNKKQQDIKD